MKPSAYVGRFAPSPTGPLHAGSLVAALASWLDARVHGGRWLVRIEDIDPPRCPPGMGEEILRQLLACHLAPDEPPQWQSARHHLYAQALAQLQANGWAYACGCTRRDMEAALIAQGHVHERHGERPYPGTCRDGLHGKTGRSWRFHAQRFPNDNDGVVLAATAGAINVRLGGEALKSRTEMQAPQGLEIDADMGDSDATPGLESEVGHLRSVVGLVWRSVVVWMLLLALLTLARLLG